MSILFGAEEAIARVAQTRNDVAMLVQVVVHTRDVDVHVRMVFLHPLDAFRRCNQVDQTDVTASALFDEADGRGRAAAGGKHRVRTISSRSCASAGSLQ